MHKEEWEEQWYENGASKEIVGHSNQSYEHFSEVRVNMNDLYFICIK